MTFRAWLGLFLCSQALGAYPDCNFLVDYCVYNIGDNNAFGNAWFDRNRPASKRNDICNATSWKAYDDCLQNCPLEFVITEPKEFAMKLCLQDTYFKPFRADAHLDLSHELNGKELEVVAPGNDHWAAPRYACDTSHFQDKNYTNKIVIAKQGQCGFSDKIGNIAAAGAAVGLLVQGSGRNYLPYQLTGMEGSSHNVPIVSFGVVQAGTDFIIQHLDNGGKVKGKVQLTCKDREPDEHLWDDCSYAGAVTTEYGGCGHMPNEEDRLCTRCPVEATVGGKVICIRGNTLLPRRAINHMWASPEFTMPHTASNMVYLTGSTWGGCWYTDYSGHSGKVVFIPPPSRCMYYAAVIEAQKAGVKALIVLTPGSWSNAWSITGTSTILNISVHATDPKSYDDFVSVAQTMPYADGGYVFNVPAEYRKGQALPYTAPITPEPVVIVEDKVTLDTKKFEFTGIVIAMIALIITVLAAILLKTVLRKTVEHEEIRSHGFHMPLGVASAALSLTLLSIVTTVSFILAYTNGQDSTETAIDDGNFAINDSFVNSEEVVSDLNIRWRETVLDAAWDTTYDFFSEAITLGKSLRDIFSYQDGTWATFEAMFPSYHAVKVHFSWRVMIRTVTGFHISDYSRTDARPDSVRNDMQQHVSITNNGFLYAYEWYWFSSSRMAAVSYSSFKKGTLDAFNSIGEFIGRWQDYVGGYSRGDYAKVWTFSTYTYVGLVSYQGNGGQGAEWEWLHPVVCLLPIFDVSGNLVGNVELTKSVRILNDAVTNLVRGFSDAENVTVFVVRDDGVLVTSSYGTSRKIDQYIQQTGMVYAARESYSLDNTYGLELNSMGHHLKFVNNGSLVGKSGRGSGEFDQSAWYKDVSGWWIAEFTFQSGSGDTSGNNFKSEVRDGNACDGDACIVTDSDPARDKVLHFDGHTVFYMYNNLTVDTPRVKGTQVSASGQPWRSSFPLYNTTRTEPDGSELVTVYDAGTDLWNPVMREPFVVEVATISLWIKPDVPISDQKVMNKDSPRIFSDTEQGDARMLWYANGIFYLGVENYGCITKVIPGGPPVGVWTHLSASVDQLYTKVCRIYVNGTLYSEVPVSQYTSVSWPFYQPYRFGHFFQGSIDDIRLFNNSLTAAEALTLYETGKLVKEIPKKEWVYNYRTLTTPGTVGMTFSVGILIPKDDVLRTVQESNTATKAKLEMQQENTQTKLDQKMGEALFIVVPILLICVLCFLVFNDFLTAPFALLALQMNEASLMRLTSVQYTRSIITEMNVMYKAMQAMVRNLNEFRSFMPASVLLHVTSGDEEDEKSTVITARSSRSGSKSHIGGTLSTKSIKIHSADVMQRMALTASKRRAACMMVNVVDWHAFIKAMDGAELVIVHGDLVNTIVDIVNAFRGVTESFSGDRFYAGFNTVRPITGYKLSACEAAVELKTAWKLKQPPSIAVVSGDGLAGNMGSTTMKKHTFMSVAIPWGYALERVAKEKGVRAVTDDFLAETVSDSIMTRIIDVVEYNKRASRLIHVYELAHKHNVTNNEWMYQLEMINRHDYWNEFAKALFARDFAKALTAHAALTDENIPADLKNVYTALTLRLHAGTFEPTVLTYC